MWVFMVVIIAAGHRLVAIGADEPVAMTIPATDAPK
jgi:hypothetical protein